MTDERGRRRAGRGLPAIHGALGLLVVLLVVQMWLLTATLETYLAGHREAALPGALISGALFAGCVVLYFFIGRADAAARAAERRDSGHGEGPRDGPFFSP